MINMVKLLNLEISFVADFFTYIFTQTSSFNTDCTPFTKLSGLRYSIMQYQTIGSSCISHTCTMNNWNANTIKDQKLLTYKAILYAFICVIDIFLIRW